MVFLQVGPFSCGWEIIKQLSRRVIGFSEPGNQLRSNLLLVVDDHFVAAHGIGFGFQFQNPLGRLAFEVDPDFIAGFGGGHEHRELLLSLHADVRVFGDEFDVFAERSDLLFQVFIDWSKGLLSHVLFFNELVRIVS